MTAYVLKRPGADEFLKEMAKHFELVVYTASLSVYADPVLDLLDPARHIVHRLFREHCVLANEVFVKDLGLLGRELKNVIIVDNSPPCYALQPENGIPIKTWIDDFEDDMLFRLIPLLRVLSKVEDVRIPIVKLVVDDQIDSKEATKLIQSSTKVKTPSTKPNSTTSTKGEPEEGKRPGRLRVASLSTVPAHAESARLQGLCPSHARRRSSLCRKSIFGSVISVARQYPQLGLRESGKRVCGGAVIPAVKVQLKNMKAKEISDSDNKLQTAVTPVIEGKDDLAKGNMLQVPGKKQPRRPSRRNKKFRIEKPVTRDIQASKKESNTPNHKDYNKRQVPTANGRLSIPKRTASVRAVPKNLQRFITKPSKFTILSENTFAQNAAGKPTSKKERPNLKEENASNPKVK